MWRQRLGRNGGRSHCLLEGFQSHYGLSTGHPSLTSWLKVRVDGVREREREGDVNLKRNTIKFNIQTLKGQILFFLTELPEI